MQTPIGTIVIVGGGVAGWAAAAGIANSLRGQTVSIVLLDIAATNTVNGAESTLPQTLDFHKHLGIDERNIVCAAHGTFRLGTEYRDWLGAGQQQLRPLGSTGANIGFIPFHHFATSMRREDGQFQLNDYSVCAAAARLGTFSRPDDDPRSLLSRLTYGLNLDADKYAQLLQRYATQLGVSTAAGDVGDVTLRESDGFIEAVTLTDGRRFAGDLFVDCSGQDGLLIEDALQCGYTDWSEWLPCNRMAGVSTKATDEMPAVVRCSTADAGWLVQTPLRNRICNQYVYSAEHLDKEEALRTIRANSHADENTETWHYEIRNGHREKFWSKNCVALGAAAGAFEPLEMTGLHLLQTGVTRLMSMFPDTSCSATVAAEYNRATQQEYEHIRDYLAFNYVVADGQQSPFWKERKSCEMPDTLRSRLALFESHGRLTNYEYDTFSKDEWASLFINGGRWPRDYDPLLDVVDGNKTQQHFARMREAIKAAALRLPSHGKYIDDFCGKLIA